MAHVASNELVIEISRDLITQLAPEELPLFRATSQAFQQDAKCVLASQDGREEMLGFGLGDAVALLTPAVLAVVSGVVTFLLAEVAKATNAASASLIQETVRRLFKSTRSPAQTSTTPLSTLTTEQLAQVRSIALKQARQMKLSETRAKVLADAIVGKLAITTGA